VQKRNEDHVNIDGENVNHLLLKCKWEVNWRPYL